jgi:hypothetical protein
MYLDICYVYSKSKTIYVSRKVKMTYNLKWGSTFYVSKLDTMTIGE